MQRTDTDARRSIVRAVFDRGVATTSELTEAAGVARSTVGQTLNPLVEAGLLEKTTGRGRSPNVYRVPEVNDGE